LYGVIPFQVTGISPHVISVSVSVSLAVGKACIIPPTGGIEYKKRKKKKKENTHTHSKSPM
jgi:hypothetical protein